MVRRRVPNQIPSIAPRFPTARTNMGGGTLSRGSMRFANTELWGTVSASPTDTPQVFKFWPSACTPSLGRLDIIGGTFELWRLVSVRLRFQTGSGTTQNGRIVGSIDFDPEDTAADLQSVQTHVPNMSGPLWKDLSITLSSSDVQKVNRAPWMFTNVGGAAHPGLNAGFLFHIIASATPISVVGVMYVDYVVEFANPATTPTMPRMEQVVSQTAAISLRNEYPAVAAEVVPHRTDTGYATSPESVVDLVTNSLFSRDAVPSLVSNIISAVPAGYLNSDGSSSPGP